MMHNTRVLPHVHTVNTDEQERGEDVAFALPAAKGADGEAIPASASQATGYRAVAVSI